MVNRLSDSVERRQMVQKIVLIDDDHEDLEIIAESIRMVNPSVQCLTFLDACDAITLIKEEPASPEVIIIDFSMPKMSGLDCLAQLRKLEKLKEVLFVMYSSAHLPQSILQYLTDQGVLVFKKPSSFDELNKIVSKLIFRL
jgi:CheY-like chemotaxis protein